MSRSIDVQKISLKTAPDEPATPNTNLRRRRFLLGVGVGTAGAAAAVALKPTVTEVVEQAEENSERSGYRLTSHIKHYYRTAKV
jgi:hypothetical protein